jgi:16S rRNA (guanine(527)-N(7))-methyltransferase RsmG
MSTSAWQMDAPPPGKLMFRDLLAREFSPYGTLSQQQLDLVTRHFELLQQWNARMNLTRIESLEDVVRLHYCESFFLGAWFSEERRRVVDVGSGPGFPGIPVAILRSEIEMTLLESNGRKCTFLRESSRGLQNVRVLNVRSEQCQEGFDWVISRAVAVPEVIKSGLAANFALLVSKQDAPSGWQVIDLPWGSNRVLSVSRETVSRET